jgi:hypothetical protein
MFTFIDSKTDRECCIGLAAIACQHFRASQNLSKVCVDNMSRRHHSTHRYEYIADMEVVSLGETPRLGCTNDVHTYSE